MKSGTGETGRVKAIGETTKILSRWEGGYVATYSCTGKGGGKGGGQKRHGHHKNPRGAKSDERIVGRKAGWAPRVLAGVAMSKDGTR